MVVIPLRVINGVGRIAKMKLDTLHVINVDLLSQQYYFNSLISEASSSGLLGEADNRKIQIELLALLAEQTDKWTKGESSSIRVEKAQDILESILFVIGVYLKTCSRPEEAVNLLKIKAMKELFTQGLVCVRRKLTACKLLQQHIKKHLLKTPNVYYRSTIVDGINGFFKLYRIQFSAHEIHITADYPTYMGRPQLNGIEFIEQYLKEIESENTFCTHFAANAIHHLLYGLSLDYRSIPMNLYEPVLASSLGLILVNRSPKGLDLTKQEVDRLHEYFQDCSQEEIQGRLQQALVELKEVLQLSEKLIVYIGISIQKLSTTIKRAADRQTLDKVFLVPAYPENQPMVTFSFGERMEDRKYCKLLKIILRSDNSEEKVNLILQKVHALTDLIDLLEEGELIQEEVDELIDKLPLPEFIALLKNYPNDDFLVREGEQMLYRALQKRRNLLTATQQAQLDEALKRVTK